MDIVLELIRNTAHGYWCCFKSINPPKFPTFQNLLTQPITWWWLGIFLYDQRNVTVTNLFHRKFYPKDPLFLFLISSVWKKKWYTFINDSHVDKVGFSNRIHLKGSCFAFSCQVDVLQERQSDRHDQESVQSYIVKHRYCLISLSSNYHRYDQTLMLVGVWKNRTGKITNLLILI